MTLMFREGKNMFVGIDLGTTHSLVAVWQNGCAPPVLNALGKVLTPSVVSVDNDGRLLVGEPARERLQSHPHLSCAVFKDPKSTRLNSSHLVISDAGFCLK